MTVAMAFLLMLPLLAGCSCGGQKGGKAAEVNGVAVEVDSAEKISPEYAKGFTVKYLSEDVRLVEVGDPQHVLTEGADDEDYDMPVDYRFALVRKGAEADVPEGYKRVDVPIDRTICMTSLQLSNFTALDAHDVIRGITGTKNLFDEDIKERVKKGEIVKIGMEGDFDPELVLAANPDVIFISPFKRGGYDAIKETGVTLVPHLGYKELEPLGQAEWIKFVAMFIGKEKEANEVFTGIKSRYEDVKKLTAKVKVRPTVFSGEMHGGNWYAVGGRNHLAQLFRDAGADYIIKDENTGGVNIEFEQMYAQAANADYWRILNSFPGDFSYDALKASEPRNELFKAFKERHVVYCNMKQTPYYELTPVQPDVLLNDLVAIFHPDLVAPDYQPRFYRLLK
ncbi:MAG: ABC transporter substrate-binding protein [Bacteroidaceae bacterium]|nr:ABC transporter substrate-binding protein [Bacteroidaceae bacterium]